MGKEVCWKCRWLVLNPGGFFKRRTKRGPCDKCLGQMTAFQFADQNSIWLSFIPPKKKEETPKTSEEEKKDGKD